MNSRLERGSSDGSPYVEAELANYGRTFFFTVMENVNTSDNYSQTTRSDLLKKMEHILRNSWKGSSSLHCISEIIPHILFISNPRYAIQSKLRRSFGITHIINIDNENMYFTNDWMRRNNTKVLNTGKPRAAKSYYKTTTQFIEDAIQKNGKVLVICSSGQNKSVAVCISYFLMRHLNPLSLENSIKRVCKARRPVLTDSFYLNQLVDLSFTIKRT